MNATSLCVIIIVVPLALSMPGMDSGLKCIHEQPANGQPAKVVQCDILGGAHYCAKMVAPWGTAKTCGVGVILDAFEYFGLTSDGCIMSSGYTFCLCSTSE